MCLSNLSILSLPDDGYSRNVSCALHLNSTCLLWTSERNQRVYYGQVREINLIRLVLKRQMTILVQNILTYDKL